MTCFTILQKGLLVAKSTKKIEVNKDVLETSLSFRSTLKSAVDRQKLIAGLDMSISTIQRFCVKTYGVSFDEAKDIFSSDIPLQLMQKAVELALSGNATMLIFCLKNLCGWKDNPDEKTDDTPVKIVYKTASGS